MDFWGWFWLKMEWIGQKRLLWGSWKSERNKLDQRNEEMIDNSKRRSSWKAESLKWSWLSDPADEKEKLLTLTASSSSSATLKKNPVIQSNFVKKFSEIIANRLWKSVKILKDPEILKNLSESLYLKSVKILKIKNDPEKSGLSLYLKSLKILKDPENPEKTRSIELQIY